MYTYIHTHTYVYVYTQTHACTHARTHRHTHTNKHRHTYWYTHTHTRTHTRIHTHMHTHIYTCTTHHSPHTDVHGLATVSKIDKIIRHFCRISSLLKGSFAKETCNFIDPTNQSHPICISFALSKVQWASLNNTKSLSINSICSFWISLHKTWLSLLMGATVSRIGKIIGLFCRIQSLL